MEQITLDLIPSGILPVVHASQYDEGRQWRVNLTDNGTAYTLSTEEITLKVRKGDGTAVTTAVTVVSGKTYVDLATTEQMTAVAFENMAELHIEKDGAHIGTLNFIIKVEPDNLYGDRKSHTEIHDLAHQVDECVTRELKTVGAKLTGYDNTESGLDATNVQDAIDELAQKPSVDAYTKQESDAFITDEYDATSTYAIGDMVIHENALYVCSTAITTAEAWNSAHWTLTDIATAIGTVKTAIPTKTSDLQNDSGFAQIDDSEERATSTYSSEKIEAVVSPIAESVDYLSFINNTITQNKYADYSNMIVATLNGLNCMSFDVRSVSKLLYKYKFNSPDLRGLYFTDVNGQGIIGYQAIASEQEITIPVGAVMCYATVNTADDILCYDIYGSLASFRDTLDDFADEVANVEAVLEGDKPVEILKAQASYTNKDNSGGVKYTWSADHKQLSLYGTRTGNSFDNMLSSTNSLPSGFVAGKAYSIKFSAVNPNIALAFLLYKNGENTSSKKFFSNEEYTLPSDVTGLVIRIIVDANGAVNETINCPEIYTTPESKGLVERVDDLEEAVFGDESNPLAKINDYAGMMSLFHTVGCIGDSLASGECAYKSGGTVHYVDLYPFSWGQCLARLTGNTYYNFSQGGLTTKTWLASNHATDCFDGNHNCDCYFIGLGQNDKNVSMTVGTTADIDLNNYNNNADTYCGNYGKIIQKLQELQPKAPIFCFIDPNPPHNDQDYNNAVKAVVALFSNVYLLDLDAYAKNLFRDSNEIIGSQLRSGHYSALGYQQVAYVVATYVDWIVRHNLSAFSQVEFIGTNYVWTD